jgi:1-acyl-sn-glycerol-3-phosphate acyltransferase
VLVQALPQFQLRWIAKRELLWIPILGWAIWASKHIIIDRADPLAAVKSLKRAKERIAAGVSIVIFPEGTRSRDGRLLPFKKGGFLLAVESATKIVPVTIRGSAALLPPGSWKARPGTVEISLDQPIAVDGYRAGKLRALVEQVRERIAAHAADAGEPRPTAAVDSALSGGGATRQSA